MARRLGMAGGLSDKEVALAWASCTWAGGTTDDWTCQVTGWVAGQVVVGIGLGVQRGI